MSINLVTGKINLVTHSWNIKIKLYSSCNLPQNTLYVALVWITSRGWLKVINVVLAALRVPRCFRGAVNVTQVRKRPVVFPPLTWNRLLLLGNISGRTDPYIGPSLLPGSFYTAAPHPSDVPARPSPSSRRQTPCLLSSTSQANFQ